MTDLIEFIKYFCSLPFIIPFIIILNIKEKNLTMNVINTLLPIKQSIYDSIFKYNINIIYD